MKCEWRIEKQYGHYIRDRIKPAILGWLNEKTMGDFVIEADELDPETMMRTITVVFTNQVDAERFRKLQIPVDLYREKFKNSGARMGIRRDDWK
ncbi:hypothetical protein [Nitrospina gracilis]|uniref:hypothetical protein n=1 Tax=Nitrospina gracilis TaxID=35801 RepID=UPI001F16B2A3|nr:hypothetical protein [Nitrospina gracilis]MCF8721608.1 hypothetical protein [Nitrospina gracilis Nb-211]